LKRLAVITKEYPEPGEPVYAFVEQLVGAIADAGVEVTVIAPVNAAKRMMARKPALPPRSQRKSPSGRMVTLLRPRYLSFGGGRGAGQTLAAFERAVLRALKAMPRPDALYAHFVFPSGLAAAALGRSLGIPAFMAYGESTTKLFSGIPKAEIVGRLSALSGVVAVSGENARILKQEGYFPYPDRIGVFPNAVDPERFYPMDKQAARAALGFAADAFIVAFVGGFIERKGVAVLSRALDAAGAASIFIGKGPVAPSARDTLFVGALDHDQIARYLASADVFALPTLNEGCCNAIVEALACGVPVISSDRPFNDGLLTGENSIRVDPTDPEAVAGAISRLISDRGLLEKLAAGARRTGAALRLDARADGILRFMEERM
jgi:teichuronic acid biosynthesis glycosyltransferase TuaC